MYSEEIRALKAAQLDAHAARRWALYRKPVLRQLFFELTLRCNAHCFHCGSSCGYTGPDGLPAGKYREILRDVKEELGTSGLRIALTGGEPMLREDFFEVADMIREEGLPWGMTSNATLISRKAAGLLHKTGMKTISVSIDGIEETHDRLRSLPGGYRRAMEGIDNLLEEGGFEAVQVTTVVNRENISELDALYEIFLEMDIDSWRVIGLEPIGRAKERPEMLLTPDDQRYLFDFIRDKREEQMPVTYGCSHFLGLDYEREVRKAYFLCNAGVYTASIMADGSIGACLDIERRSDLIQGNVFTDRFTDVWKNRFEIFRRPLSERSRACLACPEEKWCAGGAHHSWDYDKNEPQICFKGILFP